MLDQDLKNLWQNATPSSPIQVDQALLLQEVRQEASTVYQKIKWRDWLEISVALLIMPLFGLVAWFVPFTLTKIGAALVIPWCALVIYQLRRARRKPLQDPSLPLEQFLLHYQVYLQQQVHLLQGVLYWYLLPFSCCMVLFLAGFPFGAKRLLVPAVALLGINVLVYFLNRRAIKKDLRPLLSKVNQTLSALKQA
ncbi:hypothetical protein TH63_04085 [Rufibacter radiotolerans]|uniref:Uncharacterized protein n=1 Tax=Rufibacter radiotolerans TaxID=1379910 RepID=A0A0H4VMJ8_9BACT|nr:hypothetical protein [Rufibacter radiotolerans]AKQ44994.1 hypothetical protein TH63_04085 [Rufibacter radiotolerans]